MNSETMQIYKELESKPYLIDFMKTCIALTKNEREMVLEILKKSVLNEFSWEKRRKGIWKVCFIQ